MERKTKIIFCILLFFAIFLAAYLTVQLLTPEPIAQELERFITKIANPPEKVALDLMTAYRKNQPERIPQFISPDALDRLCHRAALTGNGIEPADALKVHTETIHRTLTEKGTPFFQLGQIIYEPEDRVHLQLEALFAGQPERLVFDLVLLKNKDGNWACDRIRQTRRTGKIPVIPAEKSYDKE